MAIRGRLGGRPSRLLRTGWLLFCLCALVADPAAAQMQHGGPRRDGPILAPGWEPLAYPAPAAGSYELPVLGTAADGDVLDSSGRTRRLHEFIDDSVVVLSFIYTKCPDVNACPMATYVLTGVSRRLSEEAAVRDRVRLVTLSFDPQQDSPQVMREYGKRVAPPQAAWEFLTTESERSLAPILEAYGQTVRREYDEDGKPLGTISHILRVYLVDAHKRVRNIYTTSFLHAETVWSDIRTLLMEQGVLPAAHAADVAAAAEAARHGPGDDKGGYERADYETRSKSLPERRGRAVDLLAFVRNVPRGLPDVPVPADNALTAAKIQLGRKLFFDRRLSRNDTFSCAMCHVPEQGFTSNEMATAVGIEGRSVRRNAPTIYNVAFNRFLFHDAREDRLEQQIWGPLLAANEMGNPSVGYVLAKIRGLADYDGLFEAAFDGRGPTMETLGMALASYERTLVSANSAFDRWHFAKEDDALSPAAKRGFGLFTGRAKCGSCHTIQDDHALFTDQGLHNTGIGYRQAMRPAGADLRVPVAPGTFLTIDPAVIAAAAERPPNDLGRYEVTERPQHRWQYRTPSLRNVALTAPYMHDGSLSSLREVVEFYNAGGIANELLDPLLRPLDLSENEIDDLVAFLLALSGDNVDTLVADAFAAPVGDPG